MTARAGDAASLRRRVRRERRNLPARQRAAADATIRDLISKSPAFTAARYVALYFSFDGEPDIAALLGTSQRKAFFAPVLGADGMMFAALGPKTTLRPNEFGIAEPHPPELIDPRSLDLVLAPLVAFDVHGNRIGVGAGYYDRCFAFLRHRRSWFRPKLLGVAYSLQQVEPIEPNPWDVPLWGVVTEQGRRTFTR